MRSATQILKLCLLFSSTPLLLSLLILQPSSNFNYPPSSSVIDRPCQRWRLMLRQTSKLHRESSRSFADCCTYSDFGSAMVTLYVGPRLTPFHFHKKLLTSKSSYFRTRFDHVSGSTTVTTGLYLPEYDVATVEMMRGWLYRGTLQKVTMERAANANQKTKLSSAPEVIPIIPAAIYGYQANAVATPHPDGFPRFKRIKLEERDATDPASQDPYPKRITTAAGIVTPGSSQSRGDLTVTFTTVAHQTALLRLTFFATTTNMEKLEIEARNTYIHGEWFFDRKIPADHVSLIYENTLSGHPLRVFVMRNIGCEKGRVEEFEAYIPVMAQHTDFAKAMMGVLRLFAGKGVEWMPY